MRSSTEGQMHPPVQSQGGWMITFADLLSLLLTFFVLMFSMSTVQFESWKAVVETMSDEFNQQRPKIELKPEESINQKKQIDGVGLNLNYLRVLLERAISGHASFEGVTVRKQGPQVIISIPANRLFERKDTQLISGSARPLRELAGTLAQVKNKIRIAGHTDSVPISSGKYRSNWDLSMARARIVAGILTDFGYRKPITVLGFADTENRSIRGDNIRAQNLALDERVDIVIVQERGQKGLYDLF